MLLLLLASGKWSFNRAMIQFYKIFLNYTIQFIRNRLPRDTFQLYWGFFWKATYLEIRLVKVIHQSFEISHSPLECRCINLMLSLLASLHFFLFLLFCLCTIFSSGPPLFLCLLPVPKPMYLSLTYQLTCYQHY